jgi:hypothetical protein
MANRYAVANGDWSNTATWDGGTLPTADDIVRPNGFNVTIDQDITVQELRNDASSPSVAGGGFTLTGNYTVNISTNVQCFASSLLTYNGSGVAYIIGSNPTATLKSSTTTNSTTTLIHSGTGDLTVDLVISDLMTGSETDRINIKVTGGGTLRCLKSITKSGTTNGTSYSSAIRVDTTNGAILYLSNILPNLYTGALLTGPTVFSNVTTTFNISGDIGYGLSISATQIYTIYSSGINTVFNITGNIINRNVGGQSVAIFSTGTQAQFNIIGDLYAPNSNYAGNPTSGIYVNGNESILNITGNLYSIFRDPSIRINATCNIIVIGNIFAGFNSSNTNTEGSAILTQNVNTSTNIIVTGNIYGGASGGSNFSAGIYFASNDMLTVTGNVFGGTSVASSGIHVVKGIANITGTVEGGINGSLGILVSSTGILNHIGMCQASSQASAIGCNTPTTSVVTCTGPFLRNGFIPAIASQTLRINALSNPYFEFRKSDNTDVTYVDEDTLNFPIELDVREGTSYASGLYTGTLAVPLPSNVRVGIATDDTIGTADLTAEDFWNYLVSNGFASGSMGERMKNVSTVASTGAQIASYSV